jgi:hypothetical protein
MRYWQTVLVGFLVVAASATAADPPGAAHREAMKKLDFLAGKWAGDATIQTGKGPAIKVKQTEDVQFRLGGVVLLIEGKGTGKQMDTEAEGVVFNALAAISYDVDTKKYKMRAFRMEGVSVDPELTVTETGFVWGFTPPKSKVQIRYTATVKSDTWTEVGEVSLDGKTWNKFLEMNLKRVKE